MNIRDIALHGPYNHLDLERIPKKEPPFQASTPRSEISIESRFEGIYICARPGAGKTQLIQDFLLTDLDMVARGEASVVVLDPTGDVGGNRPSLIHVLTRLKRFARGGDLYGKLIYIDPLDPNYTLPINLLSVRPASSHAQAISSAITSYLSIMGSLMGTPLTDYQKLVFQYAVQVALAFPNPTLETLQNVIAPNSKQFYAPVFDRLHPRVQNYLLRSYDTRGPMASREQILARLEGLVGDPLFYQIFSGQRTALDFTRLINEPSVIVLNASRELGEIKELYGRYFLSMLKQAGERRPENAIPCFIYVDECDEFVDFSVADIRLKLRRNRMGLTLANQETGRIRPDARETVLGFATKFVNATDDSARELGANMGLRDAAGRVDTSALINRESFDFAFHTAGMNEPQTYTLKPFAMNKLPKMSEFEWNQIRQEIRNKYYERIQDIPVPPTPAFTSAATSTQDEPPPPQRRPRGSGPSWQPGGKI